MWKVFQVFICVLCMTAVSACADEASAQTTQPPIIQQQTSPAPMVGNEAIKAAFKAAEAAGNECRAKRLSGEIKTYVETARCANPRIMQAFSAENYKYMDLIASYTARRLEIAEKLDRNELTEIQAQAEIAKVFTKIGDEERRREAGR